MADQVTRGGAPGIEPHAPTPIPTPLGDVRVTTNPPAGR